VINSGINRILARYNMAQIGMLPVNAATEILTGSTKTATSITGIRHNPNAIKVFS
jgi:hypothetical protein